MINAIVLMGGYAKRLLPLSNLIPKGLLPTPKGPLLTNILDLLSDNKYIGDIYISTNSRYIGILSEAVKGYDVDFIVEETHGERDKLGSIGGLKYAIDRMATLGDGLLVIAGDNFFKDNLINLCRLYLDRLENIVATYDVGSTERASKYGVVEIDNDRIVRLKEKPADPQSSLISVGVYLFTPDIKQLINEYSSDIGRMDRMGDLMGWLVGRGVVLNYVLEGPWYDVGTRSEYIMFLSKEFPGVHIHTSAKIGNSELYGNIIIMENAVISRSVIRNSVILDDVNLSNCVVENSIVGYNRSISDRTIKDEIV